MRTATDRDSANRSSRVGPLIYCAALYGFDITKLPEDELLELNRRVVERLQFIRSAKNLTQLARLSVGMAVEFDTDDGRTISGTVARLNQRTATVVSAAGRWRVSPSLLRPASVAQESAAASRIVACRAGANHSCTTRPRTGKGNRCRPIAKKPDANRLARSNNVAARYHRGTMRKRSRRSRVGRATLARRIVVGLHQCRRSISRIGALLSQQPSQTNDRRGDSEGRRIAPTIVRPSASPCSLRLDPAAVRCDPRSS